MPSEILAKAIRGETVESIHRGHVHIVDGEGNTVVSMGDPSTVTFFRSAAKPFQAMPCITSGAADAFGFTEEDIAMAIASHSGEEVHVGLAAGMLAKIGLEESDLRCGVHSPFNAKETERIMRSNGAFTQLHNNCSGKHAAMLALAKHIDAPTADYDATDSRVQKRILRAVSDFAGVPESEIAIGIDGCCVPNFAVSIAAMARSFANLVFPLNFHPTVRAAAIRITDAMMRHPHLIGGEERLDTLLMTAGRGGFISKVGADGVWLCGVMPCERYPTGLGIALKIEDGDDFRGRPVVAIEILRQLDILADGELPESSPLTIRNRRGEPVGRVAATINLASR